LIALVLALVVVAFGFAKSKNPFEGRWRLNLGRSILLPLEPPVKAVTRSQKQVGDATSVSWQTTLRNGEKLSGEYTAKCDGRLYPVSTSPRFVDAIACAPVGPSLIRGNELKDGTLVETFEQSVSPDGRVLTVKYFDIPPDYKSPNRILVYDRY
jgi:hypothetical protein